MDWLYDFGVSIWAWFGEEDHQNRVTAITAAMGVLITVLGIACTAVWFLCMRIFGRNKPEPDSAPQPGIPTAEMLTMDQHLAILDKREAQVSAKLANAHEDEKKVLLKQIEELRMLKANPEKSLAEAQVRIRELEDLLERSGNEIGGDRIAKARAALEQGNYSDADDLFAEIEARQDMAVKEAARAAFGRGEIAEAEIRWKDAATHYARAAGLDGSFDALFKAQQFARKSGDLDAARRLGGELVRFARDAGKDENFASALNELGVSLMDAAQYAEAEPLYREALEIGAKTIGTEHPDYAARLNNLAGVLRATGRKGEAEPLYREALEIDAKTIGTEHPDYALRLNNLAGLLDATGRYGEAEPLYRAALEITAKTIGTEHPDYAASLNNLALLLNATGRYDKAEPLYREALEIDAKTIGTEHPDYAIDLGNLGSFLVETGQIEEGRELLSEALVIFQMALPAGHPHIKETERRIANLPAQK